MTSNANILAALSLGGLLLQSGHIFCFIVLPVFLLAGLGFSRRLIAGMNIPSLARLSRYFAISGLVYLAAASCTLNPGRAGGGRQSVPAAEAALTFPFEQAAFAEMPVSKPLPSQATSRPAMPATAPTQAQQYLRLVRDLTDPNMEGRGPGTVGIQRARDYLVKQYKDIGLAPAFGQSYTQPFHIAYGVKVQTQELAIVEANASTSMPAAPRTLFEGGRDFNALGFSGSANFNAPLVFAGYAITNKETKYESLAGADGNALAGKVLLAYRYEPQSAGKSLWAKVSQGDWSPYASMTAKTDWATKHGACALLLVNPPAEANEPLRTAAQTSMGQAKIPVFHVSTGLFHQMLRSAGESDPVAAAKTLQELADAGKCPPRELGIRVRGQARLEQLKAQVHNVAGFLPGKGSLAGQVVVVGGHYDHLGLADPAGPRIATNTFSGADDNASGAGGVVMLARWFAARAAQNDAPADRRTLMFVDFTGEERGLLGSKYLVNHLDDANIRLPQIAAMINLDMIGRLAGEQFTVFGADSSKAWPAMLEDAGVGGKEKVNAVGPTWGTSDQAAFFAASIPVLFFHTGIHKDMHTVGDTADKINADGALRVLHAADAMVGRLWVCPQRPEFSPPESWLAGRPYVGIVPGKSDRSGCPVEHVLDNTPASRAGLKDGDVIIAWNGENIADPAAIRNRLQQAKPAQKVKFQIRRNGTLNELEITLGQQPN